MGIRKRKNISKVDVQRWVSQGFGQGVGRDYQPFFHVRDVPSNGRSSMLLGLKTGRIHHYLSDIEYQCHLLAEFSPKVTDIREQFALLPLEQTQEIADRLGVPHPKYPGTKTPIVMTSDLLLTNNRGKSTVFCVKHSSMISPKNRCARRTMDKLLIEKTFWNLKNVDWHLVTEKDIPRPKVQNIDMFRNGLIAKEIDDKTPPLNEFTHVFNSTWTSNKILISLLEEVAKIFSLDLGCCFSLLSRAIWLRFLPVDLNNKKIHHFAPLFRKKSKGNENV